MWIRRTLTSADVGRLKAKRGRSRHARLRFEHELLSAEEERGLIVRTQQGDTEARKRLAQCNLRLAASFAVSRMRVLRMVDAEVQEVLGALCLALMHAAEKFDLRRECRFTTYAKFWMQAAFGATVSELRRLPRGLTERRQRIERIASRVMRETGTETTRAAIADAAGMSVESLDHLLVMTAGVVSFGTEERQEDVGTRAEPTWFHAAEDVPESLRMGCDGEPDTAEDITLGRLEKKWRMAALERASLTPMEHSVLGLRFCEEECTLEEIGAMYGVSRERIRQLQARALGKLRLAMREADDARC